jgi:hypothetical protein
MIPICYKIVATLSKGRVKKISVKPSCLGISFQLPKVALEVATGLQ